MREILSDKEKWESIEHKYDVAEEKCGSITQ